MKFCPYCLQPHNERSDACADERCRRRLRNHKAAVRSGRKRAMSRLQARARGQLEHAAGWRDVAMGRKAPEDMFKLDGKKEVK